MTENILNSNIRITKKFVDTLTNKTSLGECLWKEMQTFDELSQEVRYVLLGDDDFLEVLPEPEHGSYSLYYMKYMNKDLYFINGWEKEVNRYLMLVGYRVSYEVDYEYDLYSGCLEPIYESKYEVTKLFDTYSEEATVISNQCSVLKQTIQKEQSYVLSGIAKSFINDFLKDNQ